MILFPDSPVPAACVFSTLASGNSTHVITRVCKTDFSLIDAFTDNSSRNTHNSAHIIPVYYTPCEI